MWSRVQIEYINEHNVAVVSQPRHETELPNTRQFDCARSTLDNAQLGCFAIGEVESPAAHRASARWIAPRTPLLRARPPEHSTIGIASYTLLARLVACHWAHSTATRRLFSPPDRTATSSALRQSHRPSASRASPVRTHTSWASHQSRSAVSRRDVHESALTRCPPDARFPGTSASMRCQMLLTCS